MNSQNNKSKLQWASTFLLIRKVATPRTWTTTKAVICMGFLSFFVIHILASDQRADPKAPADPNNNNNKKSKTRGKKIGFLIYSH